MNMNENVLQPHVSLLTPWGKEKLDRGNLAQKTRSSPKGCLQSDPAGFNPEIGMSSVYLCRSYQMVGHPVAVGVDVAALLTAGRLPQNVVRRFARQGQYFHSVWEWHVFMPFCML